MKHLCITLLLGLLVATGCGPQAKWEALLSSSTFDNHEKVPLSLKIMEGNNPVTGLQIKAVLGMKKMDHGTVEVTLDDNGEGVYSTMVKLPMGGTWVADLIMEKDGEMKEQSLEFNVESANVR